IIGGVILVLAVIAGASFWHSHNKPAPKPEVLAPRPPAAGIPGSLADVTRQQAESTRHDALQTVEQVAADGSVDQVTMHTLGQMQPGFQWQDGDQASTTYTMVSIDIEQNVVTVAVSTPSKQVCAFGRWSAGTGPTYVTMANLRQCRAIDAPADGWTTEPG